MLKRSYQAVSKCKKPFLFTLTLLPFALIGAYFTNNLMFDTYDPAVLEQIVAQVGDIRMLAVITIAQTLLYTVICGFVGYLIANKVGLYKPFTFQKKSLVRSLVLGGVVGLLLGIDHFISGPLYPQIREANISSFTVSGVLAAIFYGGSVEEVMMRLFFMSAVVLVIWKVFFRKYTAETMPQKVYIIANIAAALAFAAGHLPATAVSFGPLTVYIVARCFLLNGVAGILFGDLFVKDGIGYSMIAHAFAHIVKFLIFALFF